MSDNLGDVVIPDELAALVAANPGQQFTEAYDPDQQKLTWVLLGSGGGGGVSYANQRLINASTPLDDPSDSPYAVLAQPTDSLLVVDNSGATQDLYIDFPDSPTGKAFIVSRIDNDDSYSVYVQSEAVSTWGFPQDPGGDTQTITPGQTKTFISNGVDGWLLSSENYQPPGPVDLSVAQLYNSFLDIDWSSLGTGGAGEGKLLAFSNGTFHWYKTLAGITSEIEYHTGPYNNPIGPGTRWVIADATNGAITVTLPPSDAGFFGGEGWQGAGLSISVVRIDQSTHPVAIAYNSLAGSDHIYGQEIGPDGQDVYYLNNKGDAATFVSTGGQWRIFDRTERIARPLVVTSETTLDSGDVCFCDTSGGFFNVYLPVVKDGAKVTVKIITDDGNGIALWPHSSGDSTLIDGVMGSKNVWQMGDTYDLYCDGTRWWSINTPLLDRLPDAHSLGSSAGRPLGFFYWDDSDMSWKVTSNIADILGPEGVGIQDLGLRDIGNTGSHSENPGDVLTWVAADSSWEPQAPVSLYTAFHAGDPAGDPSVDQPGVILMD